MMMPKRPSHPGGAVPPRPAARQRGTLRSLVARRPPVVRGLIALLEAAASDRPKCCCPGWSLMPRVRPPRGAAVNCKVLLRGPDRAALIGPAWSGKSVILKALASRIARSSARQLRRRTLSLAEAPIPVRLPARHVRPGGLRGGIEAALRRLVRTAGIAVRDKPAAERAVRYVLGNSPVARFDVFIDGIDRIKPRELDDALAPLADAKCRVLVAARSAGLWRRCLAGGMAEYRLERLTSRQQRRLILSRLRRDPKKARQLLALLEADPQMAEMARNPLLLDLTCRAAGEMELSINDACSVRLCCCIVEDLVAKCCRLWPPQQRADFLTVLPRVAWSLVWSGQDGSRFRYGDLKNSVEQAQPALGLGQDPQRIIAALIDTGLVRWWDAEHLGFAHPRILRTLVTIHDVAELARLVRL